MKRSFTIVLLLCIQHVHANAYAQTVTLNMQDESLLRVFKEIYKQTGYGFSFSDQVKADNWKVSINVKNATVPETLNKLFKNLPLLYKIIQNRIIVNVRNETEPKLTVTNQTDPSRDIKGKITNDKGEPIAGATITVKGMNIATSSNPDGSFTLRGVYDKATIIVTSVGYDPKIVRLTEAGPIAIKLTIAAQEMKLVTISTGYQKIPKERATGSFEFINNEELNRRTGMDILSRLEGVTSGILFDKRDIEANQNVLSTGNLIIRGLSTLEGDKAKTPLIILNNFPYEGDINLINPNDVESVTVLKDAAAASIWGARAGNGVIVITTKQGKFNQSTRIEINSNITIGRKPDLFYYPMTSSSDMIDVETFLFNNDYYAATLDDPRRPAVSPVVEILANRKAGLISTKDSAEQIDALKKIDVRNDFKKYIYRKPILQQYSVGISGGSDVLKYAASAGYDRNLLSLVGNSYQRATLRSDNTLTMAKNLEIRLGLRYTYTSTQNNSLGEFGNSKYRLGQGLYLYPYAQFSDGFGNHLTLPKGYRSGYTDTAGKGQLLDWKWRPLDEINAADNNNIQHDILLNVGISYKFLSWLSGEVSYQYENSSKEDNIVFSEETYFTRDLINSYTQIDGSTITYGIPRGSIVDLANVRFNGHSLRGQLNLNQHWGGVNEFSVITGAEIRSNDISNTYTRTYGVNKDNLSVAAIDYIHSFPQYGNRGSQPIPFVNDLNYFRDRWVSFYGNGSYTYDSRFTLTTSFRRDASNLFGVDMNNKWKPFWSVGALWNVSNESFWSEKVLSYLKLRITYGHQGNVNNTISPYTIISAAPISLSLANLPSYSIATAGNPGLTWEKVKQFNAAIDFGFLNNKINGSIEYYRKNSRDLILPATIDLTTGQENVRTNSASLVGQGLDINISSQNINREFKWVTEVHFSFNSNKVTEYKLSDKRPISLFPATKGTSIAAIKGKNPYGIYSYAFAGLDPETGDPQGYLGKNISKDYYNIVSQNLDTGNLVYHGPAVPTYFGSINNTFSFRGFSLIASISYRLGYYFRKRAVNYSLLFFQDATNPDFDKRWRRPGDEAITTVPSMIYPNSDPYRDEFYTGSTVNVLRGDNIRLDYIRLNYSFNRNLFKKFRLQNLQFFGVVNNLGFIWRANGEKLDPDNYSYYPLIKTVTLGFKVEF